MVTLEFFDTTPLKPNDKYWSFCVGSGHAALALREDYQKQLKRAHDELGFKYVRFHGIFDDDMKVVTRLSDFNSLIPGAKKVQTISFYHISLVIDKLLEIGIKPFVEISFMPNALASKNRSVFYYKGNISLPKNREKWITLIKSFIEFLIDRYGRTEVESWFFEIWNEPDLKNFFFSGGQKDYFKLYRDTVYAIKSIDNNLRVGGPATSDNRWISDMKDYCKQQNVPLDFISTHHYPGDDVGLPILSKENIKRLAFSAIKNSDENVHYVLNKMLYTEEKLPLIKRDSMLKQVESVGMQAGDTPLYYTEWNIFPTCTAPLHDSTHAASFAVKHSLDCQYKMNGSSYWTFSDIFEELTFFTKPFSGSFGMMNIHGIPKPNYWAFYLLNQLGESRYYLPATHDAVEFSAFKKGNTLQLMIYRQSFYSESKEQEPVEISCDISAMAQRAFVTKIDSEHGNPKAIWQEMGEPEYLTKEQVEQIKEKSKIFKEPIAFTYKDERLVINTSLADNDVQLIEIELE